ncbi:MAG: hypothetical protein ACR2JW_15850 [Thermomicrobiales bacterium]
MFEHAILVASLIPEKKIREEKLPRLVFDEYDFMPRHEQSRCKTHLPRFLSRQRAAGSNH